MEKLKYPITDRFNCRKFPQRGVWQFFSRTDHRSEAGYETEFRHHDMCYADYHGEDGSGSQEEENCHRRQHHLSSGLQRLQAGGQRRLMAAPLFMLMLFGSFSASAQIPGLGLVSAVVKKIIIAMDLKVQQLQNKTIILQNAEQELQNRLHLNSLDDISGWLDRERKLYRDYYEELQTVKTVIAGGQELKNIIRLQQQLIAEVNRARRLFDQNPYFSSYEVSEMSIIYSGILRDSAQNMDEAAFAVQSFRSYMTDADRLSLLDHIASQMQLQLDHMREFSQDNLRLSQQRAADESGGQVLRRWYGQ